MKKPSKGYVYVASIVGSPNLCKIGFTRKHPEARVSELKKDYIGIEFELFGFIESDRPKRQENLAHEILSDFKFDREIFSVNPYFGLSVIERCSGKWFKVLSKSIPCNTFCLSDNLYRLSKENESVFIARCNKWFEDNNVRHIKHEQVRELEDFVTEVYL